MLTKKQRLVLQNEIDAAFLYQSLAKIELEPAVASVYEQMGAIEQSHVNEAIAHMGIGAEGHLPPSRRARILAWLAKRFGPQMVLPILKDTEKGISKSVIINKKKQGVSLSGNEFAHSQILGNIQKLTTVGMEGSRIAKMEGRHRAIGGNALRAAVLGANDGLVSNLSLIMGVAGANANNHSILVAGFAGLLAGAISMSLGEWLSVQSSRELFQRQIDIETEELEISPEQEAIELSLIYQTKGLSQEQADELAKQIISNPQTAIETLAREELGVDPEELGGSPWVAAGASFVLFVIGAIIPLFPFFTLSGECAILTSIGVSTLGLFGIGAAITLITGRSVWFSGARQVLFGWAAAAVTFGIGRLVGVSIG
jgi:VIT1/CCC1 family predicted Fe2+/Mn2+ transporter